MELSVGSLPSVVYRITALGMAVLASSNPSLVIIPGGDTRKFIPVSYTHLDVYKRQQYNKPHVSRTNLAWGLSLL